MNNLSWLLYAADILGNIQGYLIFLTIASVIGVAAAYIIAACTNDLHNHVCPRGQEVPAPSFPLGRLVAALMLGVVATVIPAQRTVYMIAASEMGEKVVSTPEAREVLDLLRERVKEALSKSSR